MKKFDITYKFTVVGVKTVEDFSAREAMDTFQQDLVDEIQIALGDGAVLLEVKGAMHKHDAKQVSFETADIMKRKALGMVSLSSGVVPYSSQFETEATPD